VIGALVLVASLSATPITLDDVRTASRRNVSALKAEIDLARGKTQVRAAKSAILPQVDLSASAGEFFGGPQRLYTTYPKQNADGTMGFAQIPVDVPGLDRSSFFLGISVNQLLYDGGRWWTQIAQAGAQEEALAGQLEEQRLASELEAVRRFYELVRAQLTLKVLDTSVDRSRAQLERAKSLYEAARVQRRDVLDAEVNLGNDRISAMRQRQAIQSAMVDLLEWLGQPVTDVAAVEPQTLTQPVPKDAAPDAEKTVGQARKHRPLVVALERQLTAAQQGVTIASAAGLPQVGASLNLNRSGANADPFFTDPTKQNSAQVGLNISWALFHGYAIEAQTERARVEVSQAELQQRQSLLELEGEVRRGVQALQTLGEIAQVADSNVVLSQDELKLEEERYAAGAGTSLDVRNAQLKVTQALLTQVTGRVDVEIARAMLRRSVGGAVEGMP
jgi:outer membrane protein TolC